MIDIVVLLVWLVRCLFFFFKQKTAYEMRISDWSSDVCSSDLLLGLGEPHATLVQPVVVLAVVEVRAEAAADQESAIGGHRHIASVEQGVDIRAKEEDRKSVV